MKKRYKNYKKIVLENEKVSLLNSNFVMIYIIHKILVLLKNHLNYLNDNIFECFFKEYNRLLFFLISMANNNGKFKS